MNALNADCLPCDTDGRVLNAGRDRMLLGAFIQVGVDVKIILKAIIAPRAVYNCFLIRRDITKRIIIQGGAFNCL